LITRFLRFSLRRNANWRALLREVPANIQEFNTIAGLIFAQLYQGFPIVKDIDKAEIAKAMGVVGTDWGHHMLPSGRNFNETLNGTIYWLNKQGYTTGRGPGPSVGMVLTTKGLIAMNAVPSELKQSVGAELTKAVEKGSPNLSAVGDLIGGIFGGFSKSVSSG
jgi:hypothetical protein